MSNTSSNVAKVYAVYAVVQTSLIPASLKISVQFPEASCFSSIKFSAFVIVSSICKLPFFLLDKERMSESDLI